MPNGERSLLRGGIYIADYSGYLSIYLACGSIREELRNKKMKLEILNDNNEVYFLTMVSIGSARKVLDVDGVKDLNQHNCNKRFKIRITVFKINKLCYRIFLVLMQKTN